MFVTNDSKKNYHSTIKKKLLPTLSVSLSESHYQLWLNAPFELDFIFCVFSQIVKTVPRFRLVYLIGWHPLVTYTYILCPNWNSDCPYCSNSISRPGRVFGAIEPWSPLHACFLSGWYWNSTDSKDKKDWKRRTSWSQGSSSALIFWIYCKDTYLSRSFALPALSRTFKNNVATRRRGGGWEKRQPWASKQPF